MVGNETVVLGALDFSSAADSPFKLLIAHLFFRG